MAGTRSLKRKIVSERVKILEFYTFISSSSNATLDSITLKTITRGKLNLTAKDN